MTPSRKCLLSPTAMSNLYCMGVAALMDARQAIPRGYVIPDEATRLLRARLIMEEALETIKGLGFVVTATNRRMDDLDIVKISPPVGGLDPSLEQIIDGCCDVIYVAVGTLCSVGAPDAVHMALVNHANNAKFPDGQAITDINGKFQKPVGWKPPNHLKMQENIAMDLHKISEELVANGGKT